MLVIEHATLVGKHIYIHRISFHKKNHLHEVAFALAGAITLRLYDCSYGYHR